MNRLINLYQNLSILTEEIFEEISNKINARPTPEKTPEGDENYEKLMTLLQVPLEDLKKYVKSEVKEAAEDLCLDV